MSSDTKPSKQSTIREVSGSDLDKYGQLVISFLNKKECVAIPNRVFKDVLKIIENENISFTFKKDKKSKWTVVHALYCHCR